MQKEKFRCRSFSGLTIEDVQAVDLGVSEQHVGVVSCGFARRSARAN